MKVFISVLVLTLGIISAASAATAPADNQSKNAPKQPLVIVDGIPVDPDAAVSEELVEEAGVLEDGQVPADAGQNAPQQAPAQ